MNSSHSVNCSANEHVLTERQNEFQRQADRVNSDWLIVWDKTLLIQLNGVHAAWLDPVMLLMTHTLFWSPLYLFLIFLLFRYFKKQGR